MTRKAPTTQCQVKVLSTVILQTILTFKFNLDKPVKTRLFDFLSQLLSVYVETRDMKVPLSYLNSYDVTCLFEKNACFLE